MPLVAFAALAGVAVAAAQTQGQAQLPQQVADGLSAARTSYDSAVDVWTTDWPDADSARIRLKNSFASIADVTGPNKGYELSRIISVSEHLHRYCIVLRNARLPAYLVLDAYQRPDGHWTVTRVVVNTSIAALAPFDAAAFLGGPGP